MSVDVMVGCYDSAGVLHCPTCLHPGDASGLAYASGVAGRVSVCAGCGVDVMARGDLAANGSLVVYGLREVIYGVHRLAFDEHVAYDDWDSGRVLCLACGENGFWMIAPSPLYVRDLVDGGNMDPAGWVCECCGVNLCEQSDAGNADMYALVYDDGSEADYIVSDSVEWLRDKAHEWLTGWVSEALALDCPVTLGIWRVNVPVRTCNRICNPCDDLSWWDVNGDAWLIDDYVGSLCDSCGSFVHVTERVVHPVVGSVAWCGECVAVGGRWMF